MIMLTYYLFRVAAWIVPLLPVRFGYWLASLLGDVAYLIQASARHNVYSNLRRVLGPGASESELKKLTRLVFRNGAKNYYDLFRVPTIKVEELREIVRVSGIENLRQCLEAGKGVIIVAPHLGSFDLVAQIATAYSYKVTIPVEPIKPQKLFDLVTSIRAAKGISLVPVGRGASKEIYRALGRNEIVAIASDRDVMRNGVRVTFFGEETTVPDAPALLALRTGAGIVPGCSVRNDDGTYAIYIEPKLSMQVSGDFRQDVKANSQSITRALETFIRRHPDQWVAFEAVWNN